MKLAFLLTAAAVAIVVSGVAANPARRQNPEAKTIALCLSGKADDQSIEQIVSQPIKKLFLDGATTSVNEILCAANPRGEDETGRGWFRLNPTLPSKAEYIGQFSGEVTRLSPSPDGKYLAVATSAEGHPSIEIVDLPALMRDKEFKSLSLVSAYPGVVSIDRWAEGALIVKSDLLLSLPRRRSAQLFATEEFSMDAQSGKLTPLSDALNDPGRYFAAELGSPDASVRSFAIYGLRFLEDQAAVPALKRALAVEVNESLQEELRELLKQLAKAAEFINVCLSADPEALRKRGIVTETVHSVFIDGRTQAADSAICVTPEENEWHDQSWYRVDRSTRPFRSELIESETDELKNLVSSPNGRFLAAQFAGPSGPQDSVIEIVDLTTLMRDGAYRRVQALYGFHGLVSIRQWQDGDLHLTANVFLNHDAVPVEGEIDPVRLPLLSPETFVWRLETSTITPSADALHDPIHYYCVGLSDSKGAKRQIALRGLALLKDRSSIPCLELALANDRNRDIQTEIRQTVETIIGK